MSAGVSAAGSDQAPQVSSICAECGAPLQWTLGATQVRCSFCDAGMAVDADSRPVRLDCPVCSGNFCYIDGSMAGRCPYCETPLLALTRFRLLRYLFRPPAGSRCPAEGAELLLLPFWRLSGMLYQWDIGQRVESVEATLWAQDGGEAGSLPPGTAAAPFKRFNGRVVQRWLPDPMTRAHGVGSLRLRGALFAHEPVRRTDEQLGRLVHPGLDHQAARGALLDGTFDLGQSTSDVVLECQRADLVSADLSLLYYPFWSRRRRGLVEVWDAMTGQPEPVDSRAEPAEPRQPQVFDELQVVELRCDACGAGLAPGNRAVVLPCHACGAFWVVEKEGLRLFAASYARPQVSGADAEGERRVWLPFWQVRVQVQYCGKRAECVGDLRSLLHVAAPMGDLPSADGDAPLTYFVPAFGALAAPRVDYAARDMTRLQPCLEPGDYAAGEVFHCFFAPEDARSLRYAMWIQLLSVSVARREQSLRVEAGETTLWYVPFVERGRELRNLLTGMRYDRTAFRGVGH